MKYLLILFLLFGCNNNSSDKLNVKTVSDSSHTIERVLKTPIIEKDEPLFLLVKNIADALDYSKDSYFIDEIEYISTFYGASLIKYLEIPNDFPLLKTSFENIETDNAGAIFYKFDFTADGKEDLIYLSNFGAEERYTVFWMKEKKSYKLIKVVWGTLEKLFRKSNKVPYSFLIVSGFSSASWVGDYTIYQPKIKNNELIYSKQTNYKIFRNLKSPDFVLPSISFEIINDKYRLRSAPFIDNSVDTIFPDVAGQKISGNIIAEFEIGSKGKAISFKKDLLRIWWFVIMDTSSQTSKNLFYADKRSHKVGWMSSKYLKIIRDGL